MTDAPFAIGRNGEPFRVGDAVVLFNAPVWRVTRIDRSGENDPLVTMTRPASESERRLYGMDVLTHVTSAALVYRLGTDRTPVLR